jgi:hypothetical protein
MRDEQVNEMRQEAQALLDKANALQESEPQKEPQLPAKREGEYAVLAISQEEVQEIIKQNLRGGFGMSEFDLDRVKVPLGGSMTWQVPSLEGQKSVQDFSGIMLHYTDQRSFWETEIAESGGGMPPDCTSVDGITGKGNPGGECQKCQYSEWGSRGENRRGQACRTVRMIFVCRPDEIIPCVISVPPSSIRQLKAYFLRLASARIPFYAVVTKFTLQPAKMSGFDVSQIVPVMVRRLEPQEVERAKNLSKEMLHIFSKVQAEKDDFE